MGGRCHVYARGGVPGEILQDSPSGHGRVQPLRLGRPDRFTHDCGGGLQGDPAEGRQGSKPAAHGRGSGVPNARVQEGPRRHLPLPEGREGGPQRRRPVYRIPKAEAEAGRARWRQGELGGRPAEARRRLQQIWSPSTAPVSPRGSERAERRDQEQGALLRQRVGSERGDAGKRYGHTQAARARRTRCRARRRAG